MVPEPKVVALSLASQAEEACEMLRRLAASLTSKARAAFVTTFEDDEERAALLPAFQDLVELGDLAAVASKRARRLTREVEHARLGCSWIQWLWKQAAAQHQRPVAVAKVFFEWPSWTPKCTHQIGDVQRFLAERRVEKGIVPDGRDDEDPLWNEACAERVAVFLAFLSRQRHNQRLFDYLAAVWGQDATTAEVGALDINDDEAIRCVLAAFDPFWCPTVGDLASWAREVRARQLLEELDMTTVIVSLAA